MEAIDRTSVDANETTGSDTKKDSFNDNERVSNKKIPTNASLELTTAVGGMIDEDIEHRPLGESKESEEDLKEILTKKLTDLETKLKQTDEYYEKLTKEVAAAKEQYEKEREECEDVVSVAKRNIENQVSKILQLQKQKREMAEKIRLEEERLMKEEEDTRVKLQREEERLTRNVVVFQTKLLINEGIKFERDQLLSRIKFLENDLAEKEKFYQEELQKAKDQIQEKYQRLLQIANIHKGPIVDQVKSLTQRQQIVALKHAQEQIVRTISAYKESTKNLLKEMDRNKILQERNHSIEVQFNLQKSLAATADSMSKEHKQKKKDLNQMKNEETVNSEGPPDDLEILLRQKIEQLRNELYKSKDEEAELRQILEDQRRYYNRVKNQKQKIHDIEQRLAPLAAVAEHIVQKGKVEVGENYKDPAVRHEMFQKLSAILTEYDLLQEYMSSPQLDEELNIREENGICTLNPLKEDQYAQRKMSPRAHIKYNQFKRQFNKEEKKILSDVGLLGKYGIKQK